MAFSLRHGRSNAIYYAAVIFTVLNVITLFKTYSNSDDASVSYLPLTWNAPRINTDTVGHYDTNIPFIFVGGFPRSGTTLMRAILDAHPDVRCGEETRVLPRILFMRANWRNDKKEHSRLLEAGVKDDVVDNAVLAFIYEIIVKHGPPAKRYCNKDPFVLKSMNFIHNILPKAKYVLMIRDGRAIVHSIMSRKVTITGFDLTNFRDCLTRWNKGIEIMWRQCESVGPKYCMPVWYEYLVQYPKKVIPQIAAFLNLSFTDRMLHHEEEIGKKISLSQFERSTDQVVQAIHVNALKKFVGQVPSDLERDLTNVAPMLKEFGYDTARDPDYSKLEVPPQYLNYLQT